ncbi:MAG: dTMP kinase, partial [Armatimonadota bacterium]
GDTWPHLTLVLDVPPEVGMARKRGDAEADRIEQRDAAFHARVRDGYLRFAQKRPDATAVVDATPRVQDVHAQIVAARVWRR